MTHRRSFNLHVVQAAGSDTARWTAHRSLWTPKATTRSAMLGTGLVRLTAEGGTTSEIAHALLRAALAEFRLHLDSDDAGLQEY